MSYVTCLCQTLLVCSEEYNICICLLLTHGIPSILAYEVQKSNCIFLGLIKHEHNAAGINYQVEWN